MSTQSPAGIHESIAREASEEAAARGSWPGRLAYGLCWVYPLLLAALALGLRFAPIEVWLLTLFGYGPRWLVAIPLVLVVPMSLFSTRRRLPAMVLAGLLLMPILGVAVPWRPALEGEPTGPRMRVLTCNITGSACDAKALRSLIETTRPDLVFLQECFDVDSRHYFPDDGWNLIRSEPELLIASRHPLSRVDELNVRGDGRGAIAFQADLTWKGLAVRVANLHATSLRSGFDSLIHKRQEGLDDFKAIALQHQEEAKRLSDWISRDFAPLLIAGDFNTPDDNPSYRAAWSDLTNAFATAGWGIGSTYSTRLIRIRIDHVLTGPGWQPRSAWVGPGVNSQHFPLIVDLEWTGGKGGTTIQEP